MEICQTSSLAIQPMATAAKHGLSTNLASSSKSADRSYLNLALNAAEAHSSPRMSPQCTTSKHVERKCFSEAPMSDFGNIPVVPYPTNEAEDKSPRASNKGKSVLIGSVSACNANYSDKGKGGIQAISDQEDCKSVSDESEASHESVESCTSKRLIPAGKRPRSYFLEISSVNKRLKKQTDGGSSSSSFPKQGSSFMNWVLTITNGFSRFSEATPLAFAPPPSDHTKGNLNCLSLSNVEHKDMRFNSRNTGFKSIFQSLYLPGVNVKNNTNVHHAMVAEASKEMEVENRQFDSRKVESSLHSMLPTTSEGIPSVSRHHSGCDIFNGGDSNEMHNEVSMPQEQFYRFKKISRGNGVQRIFRGNESPADSKFLNDTRHGVKVSAGHGDIESACSLPVLGCQATSDGRKAGVDMDVAECSSKLMANGPQEILQNSWISRFYPKVSSTVPNSINHTQITNFATENSSQDYNGLDPLPQDNTGSSRKEFSPDNTCLPPAGNVMNKETVDHLKAGFQKLNTKLNPILPSSKFHRMEPMLSSFARRLDVLKHSEFSDAAGSIKPMTCITCGQSGHGMGECS